MFSNADQDDHVLKNIAKDEIDRLLKESMTMSFKL